MRWRHETLRSTPVKVRSWLGHVDANGFITEDRVPADARIAMEASANWRQLDESSPAWWEPRIRALNGVVAKAKIKVAHAQDALAHAELELVRAVDEVERANEAWERAKAGASRRSQIEPRPAVVLPAVVPLPVAPEPEPVRRGVLPPVGEQEPDLIDPDADDDVASDDIDETEAFEADPDFAPELDIEAEPAPTRQRGRRKRS